MDLSNCFGLHVSKQLCIYTPKNGRTVLPIVFSAASHLQLRMLIQILFCTNSSQSMDGYLAICFPSSQSLWLLEVVLNGFMTDACCCWNEFFLIFIFKIGDCGKLKTTSWTRLQDLQEWSNRGMLIDLLIGKYSWWLSRYTFGLLFKKNPQIGAALSSAFFLYHKSRQLSH